MTLPALAELERVAQACIHCGLCLPECPTYVELGNEMDSPRGRIHLMRGLATGRIEATEEVHRHFELCLDCRACESACPSNVRYGRLIEATREALGGDAGRPRSWDGRLINWLLYDVLPHPARFRRLVSAARWAEGAGLMGALRRLGIVERFSARLAKAMELARIEHVESTRGAPMAERVHPPGERRASVSLFAGCATSVLTPRTNACAQRVLLHHGCSVSCPAGQGCCGAIHAHGGRMHEARDFARRNIDAFAGDEAIVSTAAGCGAMLKQYPELLAADAEYAAKAIRFAERVEDISETLIRIGARPPGRALSLKVGYHDACHHAHAQGLRRPPRELLRSIPGVTLVEVEESDRCCGAAGSYNVLEPQMAEALGERKLERLTASGADVVATGNVGCILHIRATARRRSSPIRILHTIELFHDACGLGAGNGGGAP